MKLEHAVTSNNRITPFASLETTSETRANPIQLSRWFPLQIFVGFFLSEIRLTTYARFARFPYRDLHFMKGPYNTN